MAISIEWGNDEHTIIYWVFNGKWTWEEFSDAQRDSNRLLATVAHTVHVIGNLQNGPTRLRIFSRVQPRRRTGHSNAAAATAPALAREAVRC